MSESFVAPVDLDTIAMHEAGHAVMRWLRVALDGIGVVDVRALALLLRLEKHGIDVVLDADGRALMVENRQKRSLLTFAFRCAFVRFNSDIARLARACKNYKNLTGP